MFFWVLGSFFLEGGKKATPPKTPIFFWTRLKKYPFFFGKIPKLKKGWSKGAIAFLKFFLFFLAQTLFFFGLFSKGGKGKIKKGGLLKILNFFKAFPKTVFQKGGFKIFKKIFRKGELLQFYFFFKRISFFWNTLPGDLFFFFNRGCW